MQTFLALVSINNDYKDLSSTYNNYFSFITKPLAKIMTKYLRKTEF